MLRGEVRRGKQFTFHKERVDEETKSGAEVIYLIALEGTLK